MKLVLGFLITMLITSSMLNGMDDSSSSRSASGSSQSSSMGTDKVVADLDELYDENDPLYATFKLFTLNDQTPANGDLLFAEHLSKEQEMKSFKKQLEASTVVASAQALYTKHLLYPSCPRFQESVALHLQADITELKAEKNKLAAKCAEMKFDYQTKIGADDKSKRQEKVVAALGLEDWGITLELLKLTTQKLMAAQVARAAVELQEIETTQTLIDQYREQIRKTAPRKSF